MQPTTPEPTLYAEPTHVPTEAHAESHTETHAEEPVGGIAGAIGTFGLNPMQFAGQLVTFLILLAILRKLAYKPVLAALDAREKKIEASVKNAEAIELRMKESEKERADLLEQARLDAQAATAKVIADADARKVEMIEAAKQEVMRVIEEGKARLVEEQEAMLIAARKQMIEIAVAAATKIVKDGITEQRSQSLAEEAVRKLT